MQTLNKKIGLLNAAIIILLVITISMQGLMRADQVQGKGIRDRNFDDLRTSLDSVRMNQRIIKRTQMDISKKFDTLKNQVYGIKTKPHVPN